MACVWGHVLRAWRETTGEARLQKTDHKLLLFGSRDHTWREERDQSEFAGLEAAFAIVHKVTLQA